MTLRIMAAFLRRDALIQMSYRLAFVLDILSIVFSVATFYFVSRLVGPSSEGLLSSYGGQYFPFVLIGIAFSTYQGVGLHSFAQSIRQEQYLGTLESVLAAPVSPSSFLLASAQWDFLYATLQVTIYFCAAAAVFGFRLPNADWAAAAVILALTMAAFLSLGILSAAFVLTSKKGDPVTWLVSTASELLGGVFFPIALLPDSLKAVSNFIPMTHALEGLRKTLLGGASLSAVRGDAFFLGAFTAIFLPLGVWFFRRALAHARRAGSLGHY